MLRSVSVRHRLRSLSPRCAYCRTRWSAARRQSKRRPGCDLRGKPLCSRRENPTADFRSVADSPNLFEFVAGIKEGGGSWVFPFDAVQEICEVLRAQLAYLFLDALEVRAKVRGCGGLR